MPGKKRSFKTSHGHGTKRGRTLGKAPGTITYLGEREGGETALELLTYGPEVLKYDQPEKPSDLQAHGPEGLTQWVNVVGLSDEEAMSEIGRIAGFNSLVVEDIVNTQQRPKLDEYDDYIFGVFKMFYINPEHHIVKEHIALILTHSRVYVFQEVQADVFGGVRRRIEQKSGRIRERGADYLFFALLDALVDHYYLVVEQQEETLYRLENEVFRKPGQETAYQIQQLRKEVNVLRRGMTPVKELTSRLIDSTSLLIKKDTRIFLRDVLDHGYEINDSLNGQREMAFSLMDMYMSSVSNRMNEVMKVLTIMASIFIPLTFIAGVYGMNFKYMPELEWRYGYYAVWGLMVVLFIGLLMYFKRKDWL